MDLTNNKASAAVVNLLDLAQVPKAAEPAKNPIAEKKSRIASTRFKVRH